MSYTFTDFLTLIGSLGFFIYGMKVMSEGIQKAAGDKLKLFLSSMTKNRYLGVLSGFLITALVQSSSATTVMTVSFVNAGLLSLIESAGIMMGANIGTTITAWLVSTFGFKVKIASVALPIIAVGFPMLFIKGRKTKFWGEFLIGFALLFMGLDFLKHSVPDIKSNPELLTFLQGFTDMGYGSYLLFILVGTLLTIVVQSSSASMTITLVLVAKGWVPFDIACAMVLGENVGTTITAELASLVGNVYAKRSARIHSLFNIIGISWMLLIFPLFIQLVVFLATQMGFNDPTTTMSSDQIMALTEGERMAYEGSVTYGLSVFHTLFNVTNVIVLIGFAGKLVQFATKSVKSQSEEDEEYHLEYLYTTAIKTPGLALVEARGEIQNYGKIIQKMSKRVSEMLTEPNPKKISKQLSKLKKHEENTDRLELEIADFLAKVSEIEMTGQESKEIRSMLSIVHDLERMGDIYYQIGLELNKKSEEKDWFTPDQRNGLIELNSLVMSSIEEMTSNIGGSWSTINLDKATQLEEKINKLRNKLRKEHIGSIERKDYNVRSGLVYSNLYALLERIGDHAMTVSESINGDI